MILVYCSGTETYFRLQARPPIQSPNEMITRRAEESNPQKLRNSAPEKSETESGHKLKKNFKKVVRAPEIRKGKLEA